MIDNLFNLIINNSDSIPIEFYNSLKKLELIYNNDILNIMPTESIQILKEIIYTLYEIYNSNFKNLLNLFRRSTLVNLYNICKNAEKTTEINNFISYYKKSIINKYTENIT